MSTARMPQIGDTVWVFDMNQRWDARKIVSETSRSWVLNFGPKVPKKGPKVPKKGPCTRAIAFSQDDIDRQDYVRCNRHRIGRDVGCINDYAVLRKVAELVGYVAKGTA